MEKFCNKARLGQSQLDAQCHLRMWNLKCIMRNADSDTWRKRLCFLSMWNHPQSSGKSLNNPKWNLAGKLGVTKHKGKPDLWPENLYSRVESQTQPIKSHRTSIKASLLPEQRQTADCLPGFILFRDMKEWVSAASHGWLHQKTSQKFKQHDNGKNSLSSTQDLISSNRVLLTLHPFRRKHWQMSNCRL